MDPQQITWLTIALVSLVFSALFSGTEIAYITSDRVSVELDVKKGGLISRILNLYYSNRELFISTILVGNNIMLVIYGMGAAALIEPWIENHITHNQAFILILQTIVSTGVILITGEFFPKMVFRINPLTSLKLSAPVTVIFYIILYPLSAFTSWLSRTLMKMCGIHTGESTIGALSIGELNSYIEKTMSASTDAEAEKVENEVKIFHNALDFSSTQLRDCMIPRNEIVAADIDTVTREQLSALFTSSGRSKIIVYSEDIDNILGYVHVSELFDPSVDWKDRVKKAIFVPETLLANTMMRRMLAEKRSMAVVVDEFGGTAGIVTLEDLVEEIFGDFEDEHDRDDIKAVETAPGVYEFSGRIEVRRLNDEFNLDIPEADEYQTLAGYILFSTGTLPAKDETIRINGLDFTVINRTSTRLEEIRVETVAPDQP